MTKLAKGTKRVTLGLKYKIEKKVRSHNKKIKKAARKGVVRKSKRKDPGIPNLWPGKAEMLQEIKDQREAKAAEKSERRKKAKEMRKATLAASEQNGQENAEMEDDTAPSLAKFAEAAQAAQAAFNAGGGDGGANGTQRGPKQNKRQFYAELRKVVEMSDVIIEVLDARDPNSCRSLELERDIVGSGKKLVLLINKIDLVPKDVLTSWVKYLQGEHPTLVFKAAEGKASRVQLTHGNPLETPEAMLQCSSRVVGGDNLLQLLKNYARVGGTKKLAGITVGIVGYSNVGKSSVINSMKREAGAVKVGAEAGVTRCLQEVKLDSTIRLIDSPGVIMSGSADDPDTILRNAVKLTTVKDMQAVVAALLTRCPKATLMKIFRLPSFNDATEFLESLATSRGKLLKKGEPDVDAAARIVLTEWTAGKIPYFTRPPTDRTDEHASAEIVGAEVQQIDMLM